MPVDPAANEQAQLSHMLIVPSCLHPYVPCESFIDKPQVLRQHRGQSKVSIEIRFVHIFGPLPHYAHEPGGRAAVDYYIILLI